MTKTQTAKFSSYNKIVAFLLAYTASFTGLIRLLKSVTDFKAAFTALKLLLPTSTTNKSVPITVKKNKDFANMIDLIVSLASRAYLFAVDTSSETLLSTFQVEVSNFKVLPEASQILLAQNILLALNDNSAALIAGYDILGTELTAAGTAITLAQDEIASPSTVTGNSKTATDMIDAAFLLVDQRLLLLEKSIFGKFKTGVFANAALVSDFENASKLVESIRHTALLATITGVDGLPIEKVLVEIDFGTETKKATTNISGVAEVEEFVGGIYNVTYSLVGYITQIIATKFTLGETTNVAIKLLKTV